MLLENKKLKLNKLIKLKTTKKKRTSCSQASIYFREILLNYMGTNKVRIFEFWKTENSIEAKIINN